MSDVKENVKEPLDSKVERDIIMKNINWQRIRPAVGVEPCVGFDLRRRGSEQRLKFRGGNRCSFEAVFAPLPSPTLISFDFFPSSSSVCTHQF